jgi:hypothetical protein
VPRGDRLLAIVLGLILGLAIVAIFVFVFSEDAVDAPQIDHGAGATTTQQAPANP